METNKKKIVELKIILNKTLYENKIIDSNIYNYVLDKLLKKLKRG